MRGFAEPPEQRGPAALPRARPEIGGSAGPGGGALLDRTRRANRGAHARALSALGSVVAQRSDKRPGFTTDAKQSAFLQHNDLSSFQVDPRRPSLPSVNAAMPHRMSWKDIRDNTDRFADGEDDSSDFERWTQRFLAAGTDRIAGIEARIATSKSRGDKTKARLQEALLKRARASQDAFEDARDQYARSGKKRDKSAFLKQANSFHANVPDLGPHSGVNNPVREAGHLNFVEQRRGRKRKRSPSPMSRRVLDMSPERLSAGLAFQDADTLITTSGATIELSEMSASTRKKVKTFDQKVIPSFDPSAPFGPSSGGTKGTRKATGNGISKRKAKSKRKVKPKGRRK